MRTVTLSDETARELNLRMTEVLASTMLHFTSNGDWTRDASVFNFDRRPVLMTFYLDGTKYLMHWPSSFMCDVDAKTVTVSVHFGKARLGMQLLATLERVKSTGTWTLTYPEDKLQDMPGNRVKALSN